VVSVLLFLLAMAAGFAFPFIRHGEMAALASHQHGWPRCSSCWNRRAGGAQRHEDGPPPCVSGDELAPCDPWIHLLHDDSDSFEPAPALTRRAGRHGNIVQVPQREQYGTYPLLSGPSYDNAIQNIDRRRRRCFHAAGIPSNGSVQKYSSDLDFFLSYQTAHLFGRYMLWNFVGRAGICRTRRQCCSARRRAIGPTVPAGRTNLRHPFSSG